MGDLVNPYIAGAPVTEKRMFFGREDIFQWIENSITGQYADHILVIHGQRRVGKTSVLKQLGNRLPDHYIPVFFDLQGRTHTTLDRFLWWLAREIVRVLKQERDIDLPIPEKDDFSRDNEYFENRFLPDLQPVLNSKTLLLTFDEFDNLEESEVKEELARPLVDHLRRLMGHPHLNFIFSIGSSGRKLENMQAEYTDFFKAALYKKISFLNQEQTHHLITRPVEGVLTYDHEAVESIYRIASGHPYFTQLTCHELFARCQRTEQRQISCDDVEAVLDDVVERGTVNLKFVWDEASDIEKWCLAGLAYLDKTDPRALAEYLRKNRVRFSESDLTSGLLHLREKDVLTSDNRFVIQLLQRWLQKNRPIEQVREELTEVNPIANRYIEIGLEFKDAGLYEKAINSFQEALTISKENIQAQVNIALVYMDQKIYDKAIMEFEKALSFDDGDVSARSGLCEAHLALGDAAMAKGRSKDAAQSYLRVLAINTEHTEARQRMAELSRRRAEEAFANGKEGEALDAFAEALKYTPEDSTLNARVEQLQVQKKAKRFADLISKSEKEAQAKNWSGVLNSLEQALTLSPDDEVLPKKIAEARSEQERAQVLAGIYTEAQKAYTDKDYDTAVSLFKKIVLEDENYRDASRLLAQAIEFRRTAPKWWQGKPGAKPESSPLPRSGLRFSRMLIWMIGLSAILILGIGGIFFFMMDDLLALPSSSTAVPVDTEPGSAAQDTVPTPAPVLDSAPELDPAIQMALETIQDQAPLFETSFDTWDFGEPQGNAKIENGKLIVTSEDQQHAGLTLQNLRSDKFAVEFDVRILDASPEGHCIFEASNEYDFGNPSFRAMSAMVLLNGQAPLSHYVHPDQFLNLVTGEDLFDFSIPNKVIVIFLGDQVAAFVNGQIAYTVVDPAGSTVYTNQSLSANYTVGCEYDNFKIWDLRGLDPATLTALSAIQSEEPLFQTSFDDWDFGNPVENARVESGKLIVSNDSDINTYVSLDNFIFSSKRFAVEFETQLLEPLDYATCTLNIGNNDTNFRIVSWSSGQIRVDHPKLPDDLIIGSGYFDPSISNTITLIVLDDRFSLFINGEMAFTGLDPEGSNVYTSGIFEASFPITCEYDNFKIWDMSGMDFSADTGSISTPTTDYRTLNPANQHLYRYYFQNLSWNDARDYCTSQGGHLVTIQDAEENEFVFQLSGGNSWLGASDVEQEGVWTWVTDEPFDYMNWMPGNPSTGDMGISKGYLIFVNDNSENILPSLWGDSWVFGGNFNFTCEWEP